MGTNTLHTQFVLLEEALLIQLIYLLFFALMGITIIEVALIITLVIILSE